MEHSLTLVADEDFVESNFYGPHDWSNWVIPKRLIAGAYPGFTKEPEHTKIITDIVRSGVTTFVCLQLEEELNRFTPYKEIALSINPHLQFIAFPIPDQFVAQDSAVVELLSNLITRLNSGENLYIHCWGGHGRTGTIVACLLSRLFSLDAERALELTAKYHACRKKKKSRSPQSKCQFEQVRRLCPPK